MVATSRNAARLSRYAHTASLRRSSSVNRTSHTDLSPKNAILFDEVGHRLALLAIEPADDSEEQETEHRDVDHKPELISSGRPGILDHELGHYGLRM
jgi:hypothetical protein